ncbi:hypothetical protein IFM89_001559 [Coptis chinensis]|uniref:Uncharacterized protein n=1 Tax=Coptis chinensis TaxID=261450 RepID=A0A835LHE7_9MAGN|nr:hypothetical protein IFM89_001559 [Coptis chinensis]
MESNSHMMVRRRCTQNKFKFQVVLEEAAVKRRSPGMTGSPSETDRKRTKRSFQEKIFNVEITFAAKIPMKPIALALKGIET